MKYIIIAICILSSLTAISQEKGKDTMNLKIKDLKICFGGLETLTKSRGKYYCNGIETDSLTYIKIHKFASSVCDSLFSEVAVGKYCRFYNDDSIIVLEGTWFPEFFVGPYKEYYENGKLKISGEYSQEGEGKEVGTKKGKWIYYYKNGKIKKIVNYSNKK